jgi:hypothetical protein
MVWSERDPSLRRIERDVVVVCIVFALAALVIQRGRVDGALGVVGGGLLIGLSYYTMKATIGAVIDHVVVRSPGTMDDDEAAASGRVSVPLSAVLLLGRYALLAAGAYAMLHHLSLHPVGLVAGVSSVVVAAGTEGLRLLMKSEPR